MPRKVEVVEYDENWEKMFKKEAKRLRMVLGANCEEIEHIGSTAVKGMSAEPTIDILCVVNDIAAVDAQKAQLTALGFDPYGEELVAGQRLFRMKREEPVPDSFLSAETKRQAKERARCNLYVYDRRNKRDINRLLVVREYLRGHAQDAEDYAAAKSRLAQQSEDDIEAYSAAKAPIVDELEANAIEWQRQQDRTMSYMALGMCFGTALGAVLGALIDHTGVGISYGVSFGMLAGLLIGLL